MKRIGIIIISLLTLFGVATACSQAPQGATQSRKFGSANLAVLTVTATAVSWVAPPRVSEPIACGCGGGGGGAAGGGGTAGLGAGGGGGGGGAGRWSCFPIPVTANSTYTIQAGTAGTAGAASSGASGANGGVGGDSFVALSNNIIIDWSGGSGGTGGVQPTGTVAYGGQTYATGVYTTSPTTNRTNAFDSLLLLAPGNGGRGATTNSSAGSPGIALEWSYSTGGTTSFTAGAGGGAGTQSGGGGGGGSGLFGGGGGGGAGVNALTTAGNPGANASANTCAGGGAGSGGSGGGGSTLGGAGGTGGSGKVILYWFE